ncbi:MAG: (Fe-S)-binding protein [Thermodesulfobacteriota bacterium]|nr:(Fe-S)-binding protein [Thermodesulfobacteriota bacterium]
MDSRLHRREGYTFHLVNIDCMRQSTRFNVIMELEDSIKGLLPYLAAVLPGCTYIHGSGVISIMDDGHIIGITGHRITFTDVGDENEAEALCRRYFETIQEVTSRKDTVAPVFEKRQDLTVLEIFRALPATNCGGCGYSTCMAFAAGVFRRETTIERCPPLAENPRRYAALFHKLALNGHRIPESVYPGRETSR